MTQKRTLVSQQKYSLELSEEYFDLEGLLNGDLDGELGEEIKLELFYTLDPKDVTKEQQKQFNKEKQIANQVQEIYNKYQNDQFTKQIVFSFGYFEIEIPLEEEQEEVEGDLEEESVVKVKTKIDRYPLFSLPITIDKDNIKYVINFNDPEIQVNFSYLEPILGEDLYYQLIEEISKYELDGRLTLPFENSKVFTEIWHSIKDKLKLKDVEFDEQSFKLNEMKISLSPRANYFLAEDLEKLSKLTEEELIGCSLTSWIDDTDLNIQAGIPEEHELFFPFKYDKYQLSTLSLLQNKASIIQGPPGTGKSETISNILCHLAATGNKVLFVSQKAQALKVVKDKLKKTGVKYLYAYLPNPASAQLGEEDEIDGIAPQLSALKTYVATLDVRVNSRRRVVEYDSSYDTEVTHDLDDVIEEKESLKTAFQKTIEFERHIYQLNQELIKLNEFNISINDVESFEKNFDLIKLETIKGARQLINKLSKDFTKYTKSTRKAEFDKEFDNLNLEKNNYSNLVEIIKNDVSKTGYDRHSSLMRKANNLIRNTKLSKIRSQLPREIVDLIDNCLEEDISRKQQVDFLEALIFHLECYESKETIAVQKELIEETLQESGLLEKEFDSIVVLNTESDHDLEEIKANVLKVIEMQNEITVLKSSGRNLNRLTAELEGSEHTQKNEILQYLENRVNQRIISQWKQGITIKKIIEKLSRAFGKSKKAYKTFDNLRKEPENFNAIRDLIPIWIMELDDASRIIPLEAGMFDYVILDEASQCNVAYTLPAMFRAKRTLFVGDSEQMRDNTVMFKSNRGFDELAKRFRIPEEMQIKATGSAVQSVLEIAALRGLSSVSLHYHYRSPKELIGFSNENFYKPRGKELIALNNSYLTYGDTNKVLVNHLIESDWKEEISDHVNVAEAQAILNLVKELRSQEKYQDKSIGILTFFNAQASYIREYLISEGLKEERDNYKVSIIEGIQGDEKDIIIYSFVIRDITQKNKYIALTGESGDIRSDVNKGRVNVAFSRARLQVHCFYSLPKMPDGIWLKKYIEYVEENGEVDFYSTDLQPFDSYFEEEFYSIAKNKLKGMLIQNQVKSCGFKIDFVITNPKNGKRLAIECDGPCHFEDELDQEYGIYIDSDEERQKVLEAAGWEFYRLKYSDWINEEFDKAVYIKEIEKALQ
ncbi:MAG: AAA domain-containing protein [Candidatus Pacearchaeota archaeon]